jgi:zinc transporter
MDTGDFIQFAYEFDGKGNGKRLQGEAVAKQVKAKKLAWVNLDGNNPETAQWLDENIDYLDPIIIDALLAVETRPRISFIKNGIMIILRGMNLQANADPEDMISIRLWVDENRIISVQRRPLKAVGDVCDALEKGSGPSNSADFIAILAQRLFERMQPVLFEIAEELDDAEENIIENATPEIRQQVSRIRRRALIFKRYLTPQKDVMLALRNAEISWIDDHHTRRFQENQDRLTRYLEDLDTMRERAQIIKEEHSAIISDRMNRNMYALSIIAGVFLPLGFLTGLLGINVGGMPGVDNPHAFWVVVGLCALSGLGFIGLFKLLKWL